MNDDSSLLSALFLCHTSPVDISWFNAIRVKPNLTKGSTGETGNNVGNVLNIVVANWILK